MSDPDRLDLLDDDAAQAAVSLNQPPWRILVVDDDADVRNATRFCLERVQVDGRPLQLLEAASAAEAEALLSSETDIAVVLLDVVMESPDAGLRLVERLRARPELAAMRIVLRTGQPGYAPELEVIRRYDINDYKTKDDLTQVRLLTTLTVALRGYRQLRRLDAHQRGLEKVVRASGRLMSERQSFMAFAEGVLTQICTLVEGEPDGVLLLRRRPLQAGEVIVAAGAFTALGGLQEAELPAPLREVLAEVGECRVVSRGGYGLVCAAAHDGDRLLLLFSLGTPLDDIVLQQLELFAVNLALAYDDLKAYLELQYQAHYDRETGLRNRSGLAHALQGQPALAVAQMQIGELQEIRGVLGETVARQVLRHIAERVGRSVDGVGWAARLEGDRFALALPPQQQARLEEQLAEQFAQPLALSGLQLQLGVALGWSECQEQGLEQAIDEAGLVATVQAGARPLRSARYTPLLREQVQRRMTLLAELPRALAEDRIEMHLQPQVLLGERRVIGAEALMRLRLADGSRVPPDQFIPLAEQTGFIVALGRRMLALALAWLQRHPAGGRLSLNLSPRELAEPGGAEALIASVASAGIAPQRLRLEVTESAFASDAGQVGRALLALAAAGFELSIDDFGTGQSSLGRLAEMRVHELKLDRSLVRGIETDERARRVTRLIVELGRDLGVEVLAEGIETEGQRAWLLDHGCALGQGFLFGRPELA